MKLGVSSYSFRKYIIDTKCDYEKICDLAKEFGFDGIEFIDLDNAAFGITTDCMGTARKIKEHCEKIGLEISAYTIGGNFLCDDVDKEVERLCRCVDVAEALGAKVMRHDVCFSIPKKPLYGWREAIADMAPYIRKVTEYAEKKGIRTCTENHGHIFQSPERVEALIRAVNHPNYGWLVDMGNFLCVDADPVHAVTIAAPYAFHVHAKDFTKREDALGEGAHMTRAGTFIAPAVIGEGVVPVKRCLSILKAAGYDGYVSIEFEGREDCISAIGRGHANLKKFIETL